MKTTLKIVKIGNSKGVIIPVHITDRLKLDIDDLVEIEIKKIVENYESS
jgi:antitoxin component of MazEF toxin-antitoxin module